MSKPSNNPKEIEYKSGYKHQLTQTYTVRVPVYPPGAVGNEYVTLSPNGLLTIKRGYAWNGASGPAIDTASFMRASLVHDALYQLIREGMIDASFRQEADNVLYKLAREDGMNRLRAAWVYRAVRWFGGGQIEAKETEHE
jgi:hypothetical protein